MPTRSMPFSLVYISETILPIKIQISSLRVVVDTKMVESKSNQLYLWELERLDEGHLQAQWWIEVYRARGFGLGRLKTHDHDTRHKGESTNQNEKVPLWSN